MATTALKTELTSDLLANLMGERAAAETAGCARATLRGRVARELLTAHQIDGRLFYQRDQIAQLRGELARVRGRSPARSVARVVTR